MAIDIKREIPSDYIPTQLFTPTVEELSTSLYSDMFFDIECYPNYFLILFKHEQTDKHIAFELTDPEASFSEPMKDAILWVLYRFCVIGFNSRSYDIPMVMASLQGFTCKQLKELSDSIINSENKFTNIETLLGIKFPRINHIDLKELPAGGHSLKLYGARLGVNKLQDLPFEPSRELSSQEQTFCREYCANDLEITQSLYNALKPVIEIREALSEEYNIDLRSRSDAQIAEAVICKELQNLTGFYPKKPDIDGSEYKAFNYEPPSFLSFHHPQLVKLFEYTKSDKFYVNGATIETHGALNKYQFQIGETRYTFGKGGLHSCEKSQTLKAENGYHLIDCDVESYYPAAIRNQGLYPASCGPKFLDVFNEITDRRVTAKRKKDKITSDMLKIVINGTYGKFNSVYSRLYNPKGLIQVTLTGQLSILMLTEILEYNNISIKSANTDGILPYIHESQLNMFQDILDYWENLTQFKLEQTPYQIICSRDVNNYFAIKPDSSVKYKGIFTDPDAITTDIKTKLGKNAGNQIITDAVVNYVAKNIPLADTIDACQDPLSFCTSRNVKGGAYHEFNGKAEYIGKVVRYYHVLNSPGRLRYVSSHNLVPDSEGTAPLMEIPEICPQNIDRGWYLREAEELLYAVGFKRRFNSLF